MDAIYEVGESQEEQESTRRTDVSNVNAHQSSTSQISITKVKTHEPLLGNRPVSV